MIVTKVSDAQSRRQADDVQAKIEKLQANQDYIAMMADIELEDEESEVTEE